MIEDENDDAEYTDPSELRQGIEESVASGCFNPPVVPGALPSLPDYIDIRIGGHGCKKCGSLTHKQSNHRDCPFNKHWQSKSEEDKEEEDEEEEGKEGEQLAVSKITPHVGQSEASFGGCKKCGSTAHRRSSHKDCPYNKKNHTGD